MHHPPPAPAAPPGIRFDPGGADALERIASGPPPEGLRADAPASLLFRDVFYDTEEGDLELRGAWVRVRHAADGSRTFTVCTPEDGSGGRSASVAFDPGAEETIRPSGEPASLLRAMVDPEQMVARETRASQQ